MLINPGAKLSRAIGLHSGFHTGTVLGFFIQKESVTKVKNEKRKNGQIQVDIHTMQVRTWMEISLERGI